MAGFQIAIADPSFAADRDFIGTVTALINSGFAEMDRGMWRPGSSRVSAARVMSFVASGELLGAWKDGEPAGVARVRLLSPDEAECTQLVRAASHSGHRLGSDLLACAEQWARGFGAFRIKAELLAVRTRARPGVDWLNAWLLRQGYRYTGTGDLGDWRPEMRPHLAAECDYIVFYKDLRPKSSR